MGASAFCTSVRFADEIRRPSATAIQVVAGHTIGQLRERLEAATARPATPSP